jgi:hypothetical protein
VADHKTVVGHGALFNLADKARGLIPRLTKVASPRRGEVIP